MTEDELLADLVDFFREWIDGDHVVENAEKVEADALIVRFEGGQRIQVTVEIL